MKHKTHVIMSVALLVAAASSVLPITLVPGTYKLIWDQPREVGDPLWRKYRYGEETYFIRDDRKVTGTISKRVLVGRTSDIGGRTLAIDESKGTGKGYDTLYLGQVGVWSSEYDTRLMVKVPLVRRGKALVAQGVTARIPRDEWEHVPETKRIFDIRIEFNLVGKPAEPGTVSIFTRGAWYGTVKTDQGPVRVRLLEGNDYGAWHSVLIDAPDAFAKVFQEGTHSSLPIGECGTLENKLYFVKFSQSGGRLTVSRYVGPTGKVAVNAVDGFGNPVQKCALLSPYVHYFVSGRQTLIVPAGAHEFHPTFYSAKRADNNQVSLSWRAPKLTVRKGENVTLNLGGPVSFKLDDEKGDNGDTSILAKPQLRNAENCSIYGVRASLQLKDADGSAVYSTKEDTTHDSPVRFELPRSLKPGTYAAILTVDLRPYDKKKVFAANVQVK